MQLRCTGESDNCVTEPTDAAGSCSAAVSGAHPAKDAGGLEQTDDDLNHDQPDHNPAHIERHVEL